MCHDLEFQDFSSFLSSDVKKRKMSKRKISEKYEKIIERAAATKHKAMQDEKAAKQKETKNKGKSLEKATEFIVEKFHKEIGILETLLNEKFSYIIYYIF